MLKILQERPIELDRTSYKLVLADKARRLEPEVDAGARHARIHDPYVVQRDADRSA